MQPIPAAADGIPEEFITEEIDDDDDLGLGNSAFKKAAPTENGVAAQEAPSEKPKPAEPEKPGTLCVYTHYCARL